MTGDKTEWNCAFYEDDCVHKKLTVMDKWDVILDDHRNDEEMSVDPEEFFQFGRRYKLTVEDVGPIKGDFNEST